LAGGTLHPIAFDDILAARVREVLTGRARLTERKMFGGVAFLLDGHMCCGLAGDDLMLRVGPERYEEALSRPHARPMDFTGRPFTGYVYVAPAGLRTTRALRAWVDARRPTSCPCPPIGRASARSRVTPRDDGEPSITAADLRPGSMSTIRVGDEAVGPRNCCGFDRRHATSARLR
jgi:TfoX/Sxy family transcriptional regulator of competence genes